MKDFVSFFHMEKKDCTDSELLIVNDLESWEALISVCHGFLGNTQVPDYWLMRIWVAEYPSK